MTDPSRVHPIYTIGHSTHSVDEFLALLQQHAITAVADIRSVPFSRWQPQFNQEPLRHALGEAGIAYVFLGKELGARTDDRSCYVDGRVQYRRLAATVSFREGLIRLESGHRKQRIVVMCAEGEPLDCHRTILVARELEALGICVQHVLSSGKTESHADALRRLRTALRIPDRDLFRTAEELQELAYARQEERIAYVERTTSPDEDGGAH